MLTCSAQYTKNIGRLTPLMTLRGHLFGSSFMCTQTHLLMFAHKHLLALVPAGMIWLNSLSLGCMRASSHVGACVLLLFNVGYTRTAGR